MSTATSSTEPFITRTSLTFSLNSRSENDSKKYPRSSLKMRGSMITGPSIAVLITSMCVGLVMPAERFGCAESPLWCYGPVLCLAIAHRLRKRAFVCARETCAAACLWILQYLLAKVCLSEGATRLPRFLPRHRNRPIRELPCCPAAPSPNIRRTATANIVFLSFGCGVPFRLFAYFGAAGRIQQPRVTSAPRAARQSAP